MAGRDLTPGSTQQQAILAILALAPAGGVSRARLQDLLWPDKDSHLAAQSLRTALHGLRRALSDLPGPVVDADASRIRLHPGAVVVDLVDIRARGAVAVPLPCRAAPPDMLEGIDLPAEAFEDWLREQRAYWGGVVEDALQTATAARIPQARPAVAMPPTLVPPLRRAEGPVIGLLEPMVHSRSHQTLFFAEALIDRIATGAQDHLGARTYDYRDLGRHPDPASVAARSPDIYIRLRAYEEGGEHSIRVLAMRHSDHELLWSVNCGPIPAGRATVENAHVLALLGETLDRIAASVPHPAHPLDEMPISPFHGLIAMFQFDHAALEDLRGALIQSAELTGAPIYPALLAYLNTFSVGEHWHTYDGALQEETRALVAQAGDADSGIALALAGHATGYILHDHDGAAALLERAIRRGPHSAFAWDHVALHHLYAGRYDSAARASDIAMRMGEHNPIRFTFETTQCMIETLRGHFDRAGAIGLGILARRPKYGAALRYASVSLAHVGRTAEAQDLVARIHAMDPEFSSEWVATNRMAVRDSTAKSILELGLRKAGA
ncbi:hypothetical protein [Pseudooceanicola sp. LIPI14-2-Ac024]|uniref:hypothetical protein n=1 Tax=Pseudooceanicola sp. LIPI14-2-Ac024 TaxID=3344875 RepID=UPI0035CFA069